MVSITRSYNMRCVDLHPCKAKHVVREECGNPAARTRELAPMASARACACSRTRERRIPPDSRKFLHTCKNLRAERVCIPQISSHSQPE